MKIAASQIILPSLKNSIISSSTQYPQRTLLFPITKLSHSNRVKLSYYSLRTTKSTVNDTIKRGGHHHDLCEKKTTKIIDSGEEERRGEDRREEKEMDETRARLQRHFHEFSGDRYNDGWSDLWNQGGFLPWDRGVSNPALGDTLKQGRKEEEDDDDDEKRGNGGEGSLLGGAMIEESKSESGSRRRRKRALVPGCGRGYDVLLLASFGYDAVGLEYSQAAVDACHVFQKEHGHEYSIQDQNAGMGAISFVVGDFFKDDWRQDDPLATEGKGVKVQYDLIYDYTFFCALTPSLRPRWSSRMTQLLGPAPHGSLMCLEFPTSKPPSAGGPPFASPPEAYVAHLTHPGEPISYDEQGYLSPSASDGPSSDALIRIAHWQPKRTHEIGMDDKGNVRDYIAIWRHQQAVPAAL